MEALKRGEAFVFLDGSLTVKIDGYGEENGWGTFTFDDKQVEYVPHEEGSGHSYAIDIPKSELVALRNFLNRLFPVVNAPPPAPPAAMALAEEIVEAMYGDSLPTRVKKDTAFNLAAIIARHLPADAARAREEKMREALEQIAVLAEYNTTGPGKCVSDALTKAQATSLRKAISDIARAALGSAP